MLCGFLGGLFGVGFGVSESGGGGLVCWGVGELKCLRFGEVRKGAEGTFKCCDAVMDVNVLR